MKPMYPVVAMSSQGANPGNDSRHNKVEPTNRSGGPSTRTRRMIPPGNRGGTGHQGRDRTHVKVRMGQGRATASNPATRGGRVGSETADTNNPNRGGGVQVRPGRDMQRQFGQDGKAGVVNQYPHARPQAGAGNTSGRMAKRIGGKFRNKTKQGSNNNSGTRGSYGSMPVTVDD
jgi:hypothetical protein